MLRFIAAILLVQCLPVFGNDNVDDLSIADVPLVLRKSPPDSASLVRICVATPEKTYVACMGVIITVDMVIASNSCAPYLQNIKKVEMYAASKKMDCRNGEMRLLKEVSQLKSIVVLRPTVSFTLSPKLATMLYSTEDHTDVTACYAYCSQRVTTTDDLTTTEDNMCKKKQWRHSFEFVSCKRQVKPLDNTTGVTEFGLRIDFNGLIIREARNYQELRHYHQNKSTAKPVNPHKPTLKPYHKPRRPHKPTKKPLDDKDCKLAQQVIEPPTVDTEPKDCGSIVEGDSPCSLTGFQPSMSPIICDHKLYGFIQNNQKNPYLLQIALLKDHLSDTQNITSICGC